MRISKSEIRNPKSEFPGAGPASSGFTLLELLVSVAIIAILASLSLAGLGQVKSIAQSACCANSLRQLGTATTLYLSDHEHVCFAYEAPAPPNGVLWYFGYETNASKNSPEGERTVDETQSPLYPYVHQVGGVEICPSFPYGQAIWMPKYSGASWGYGFNVFLGGNNLLSELPNESPGTLPPLTHPSQVILFGDCAFIDTFQPPASPTHPMLEEFYMIYNEDATIHFRHGGCANILFLDGHVEKFTMYPGTLDTTLPGANVGRITPSGSMQYLR
jgi:prepilin-type N-terminal cleavage/methylation domain-containing protein/prepilin-type processing-associated H-X9-DG protein